MVDNLTALMTPTPREMLGSEQIRLLQRTLRLHRELLEATHQDAVRATTDGVSPVYLIDYEEIHRYIYEQENGREISAVTTYLLSQTDQIFVIGYGTSLEILNRLRKITSIDFSVPALDDFEEFRKTHDVLDSVSRVDEQLSRVLAESPEDLGALERLSKLLKQENVISLAELQNNLPPFADVVDISAYEAALALLNAVRPSKNHRYPNIADAINFGTVVGLRKYCTRDQFIYFPYLLTNTKALLNERYWAQDPFMEAIGIDSAVSRRPISAAYSYIISTLEDSPDKIAHRTSELLLSVAAVEHDLRTFSGHTKHVPNPKEEIWDAMFISNQFKEMNETQLESWSSLINDPLISEAQRIYDNARQATVNLSELRGMESQIDSPRRLFDLIYGIAKVVSDTTRSPDVRDVLWQSAVRAIESQMENLIRYRYCGYDGCGEPYLEIENHNNGEFFVLSWPTRLDIRTLVGIFNSSFERRDIRQAELLVGTDVATVQFDLLFPTTLDEIVEALSELDEQREPAPHGQTDLQKPEERISWIRVNSGDFDLIADVITEAHVTPKVGVFVKQPNVRRLIDFYSVTARRFLFSSWLESIFCHSGIPTTRI